MSGSDGSEILTLYFTVWTSDRIDSFCEIIENAFHDYIHPWRPRGGEILHLTKLFNQEKTD